MYPEISFPYATGIVLIIASAFVYYLYREIGNRALVYLSIGLFMVALESILDGYEASRLLSLANGDWNSLPKSHYTSMLWLDAIRGFFIVLWAMFEVLFTVEILGVEKKSLRVYIPALILIVGFIETVALNFSGIQPLQKRILVSSAGRVLGILVPVALIAGIYLLKVYREIRSDSLLFFGLGFFIHGITLPTYSFAKESGALALGAWYTFGGVIPALLAMAGAYKLMSEAKAAETVESE